MRCPCHRKVRRRQEAPGGLGLKKKKRQPGLRTVLFGMLLGLALGLLFTPRPGPDTIGALAEKRSRLLEKLIRKLPV